MVCALITAVVEGISESIKYFHVPSCEALMIPEKWAGWELLLPFHRWGSPAQK